MNDSTKTTLTALAFIMQYEGFKNYVYCKDGSSTGNATIGAGSLLVSGKTGKRSGLESLQSPWGELVKRLQDQVFAHGYSPGFKGEYKDITINNQEVLGLLAIKYKNDLQREKDFISKYNLTPNQATVLIDCCYQYGSAGSLPKKIRSAITFAGSAAAASAVVKAAVIAAGWGERGPARAQMWDGTWSPKSADLQKLGNMLSGNDLSIGGDLTGSTTGGQSAQAGGGVSKFWYLGAVHNILNNAQLEKLYLEVKLRGCNLSILKGEKVPVLMIDNRHKNALAEQDNMMIDPTTMMDTWASGWFMIGGYSYIYDPQENSNVNKWTTIMKLQRMEWPTPTEVTDPSARMVRTIRYNIGLGKEYQMDDITGIDSTELEDPSKAEIGVSDCTKRIQDLVKLMDKAGINYRIVSAKRYPIDENGNIVKTDDAWANVKFGNAYAFKCANGIRFFKNPVSDHSQGDAIDIIQKERENFNKVLSDIIDSDEILIHMITNCLSLYEETSTDDLGAATSHFHIGTNSTLGEYRTTVVKNWWEAVMKVRGANDVKGYSFKQAILKSTNNKNIKVIDPLKENTNTGNEWVLKKIYTTDENSINQTFGAHELSYDDWIEKAQATLNAEYKTNKKSDSSTDTKTASEENTDTSSNSTLKTSLYTNSDINAEAATLPAEVLKEVSTWDQYGNDCVTAYTVLNNYYTLYENKQIEITDPRFVQFLTDLKKAVANVKIILDVNPSSELISNENSEKLIKRNELDNKYRLALTLIEKVEHAIQIGNVQTIINSADSSTGEGTKVVNLITDLSGTTDDDTLYHYIVNTLNEAEDFYNKFKAELERNITRYKLDLWNSGIKYDNMGKITIGNGRFTTSNDIIKYFNTELGGDSFFISLYSDEPVEYDYSSNTVCTVDKVCYERSFYSGANTIYGLPDCQGYLYFYVYNNLINKFNNCVKTVEKSLGIKNAFNTIQLLDKINAAGGDITKISKVNDHNKVNFILSFYNYKLLGNTEISVAEYNKDKSSLKNIILEYEKIKPYI